MAKNLLQGLRRTTFSLWQHKPALAASGAFRIKMEIAFLDRCLGLSHD